MCVVAAAPIVISREAREHGHTDLTLIVAILPLEGPIAWQTTRPTFSIGQAGIPIFSCQTAKVLAPALNFALEVARAANIAGLATALPQKWKPVLDMTDRRVCSAPRVGFTTTRKACLIVKTFPALATFEDTAAIITVRFCARGIIGAFGSIAVATGRDKIVNVAARQTQLTTITRVNAVHITATKRLRSAHVPLCFAAKGEYRNTIMMARALPLAPTIHLTRWIAIKTPAAYGRVKGFPTYPKIFGAIVV